VKYPLNISPIYEQAKAYTEKSIDYTLDYNGFEQTNKAAREAKVKRLIVGNFCQFYICELCKINHFEYKTDDSSHDKPDSYDLIINGHKADCKASVRTGFEGQVTSNIENSDIDLYIFLMVDEQFNWIEPLGVTSSDKFKANCTRINKGELIRNTGMKQKLDHSYFIDVDKMKGFESGMMWAATHNANLKRAA